jgi:dTDP-4-dehydrorhamnose reductase
MSNKKNEPTIMISGGTGLLGAELLRLDPQIIAPPRKEFDVVNREQTEEVFKKYRPDIYLHCAAIVGTRECREDPINAIRTNVLGVVNTVEMSIKYKCRYVYISTEYVFEANNTKNGNFVESDAVAANNIYARSKIAGEMVVAANPNHLIIRTSFAGRKYLKYQSVFCDQFTSRDYVDILSPQYLEASKSELVGIIHIGTERKTQFELLKRQFPQVGSVRRVDIDPTLAEDTSLNCEKWRSFVRRKKLRFDNEQYRRTL